MNKLRKTDSAIFDHLLCLVFSNSSALQNLIFIVVMISLYANSDGSDQTAHLRSLIRAFAVRISAKHLLLVALLTYVTISALRL